MYIPFLLIILMGLVMYFSQKARADDIKANGVRIIGTMIQNSESNPNSYYRLGGNINTPVLSFVTKDGVQITGRVTNTFVTQFEITVPCSVYIIYNEKNPEKFLFDGFA
jgi:hypothetical protein